MHHPVVQVFLPAHWICNGRAAIEQQLAVDPGSDSLSTRSMKPEGGGVAEQGEPARLMSLQMLSLHRHAVWSRSPSRQKWLRIAIKNNHGNAICKT
eukprot:5927854-Amphidinium_carterae.1